MGKRFDTAIHKPDDGRGRRAIFLNGRLIENVVYANTRKGIIRVARIDTNGVVKLDKHRKRILTDTLRGTVTVYPMNEDGTITFNGD